MFSLTPCSSLFNKGLLHLDGLGPNLSVVIQDFARMLFCECYIEIFLVHAGVISLGFCVVNKVNISADVLLLDYSIVFTPFLRSDVTEIAINSCSITLKDCKIFTSSYCCFSVDSDMNRFFRMFKFFNLFVVFCCVLVFFSP